MAHQLGAARSGQRRVHAPTDLFPEVEPDPTGFARRARAVPQPPTAPTSTMRCSKQLARRDAPHPRTAPFAYHPGRRRLVHVRGSLNPAMLASPFLGCIEIRTTTTTGRC